MARNLDSIRRGLWAGATGATAVVLWFLVIDLAQGRPLETPRFLTGALFGRTPGEVGPALIAVYTILHYAVFAGVGIGTAWLLDRINIAPGMLLGVVLGFLLFDIIFYVSLTVSGSNILDALGWPEVIGGNLLAGMIIMGYLHLTSPSRARSWWSSLRYHPVIREGIVTGLIGAAAVALWFFLYDLASGRPLFTPAALGSVVFYGALGPEEVRISLATVLGYTILHGAAFILIGLVAAAIAVPADYRPALGLVFIEVFVILEAVFVGVLALFATWILNTVGWWNIIIGNIVAAVAIGGYLWYKHPKISRALRGRRSVEEPG